MCVLGENMKSCAVDRSAARGSIERLSLSYGSSRSRSRNFLELSKFRVTTAEVLPFQWDGRDGHHDRYSEFPLAPSF